MDAPGSRDKAKDLDPSVARELDVEPKPGDPARQAGYGEGQTPAQTRESATAEVQPNPRPAPGETSAASYKERTELRDDPAEDGE
jgi:hypothetical protein